MSQKHAEVRPKDGGYVLKDLGSTNGTFVNGRRVTACELQDGDEIRTGNSIFTVTIGTPP